MPVFHSHPRMEKWIENHEDSKSSTDNHRPAAVWVPIFKTLYESELIYEPEKTFDIELLSSKMPVVNHDEFVKDRDELFKIGKLLKVEVPIPSKGM